MTFTLFGPKVRSPLAVMFRGSVTIGGTIRSRMGENCREHQVERLVPVYCTTKQTSQVYRVSSEVNSHHGQVMVVAWRKFGKV